MKLETFFEKFNQFADAPDSVAKMRELILTLAVQGKLVQRIKSEGIGSEILKDAVVSDEPSDDLPELPTHWVWARLGSIATRMDSGWSPACFREPAAKGEWGVLKTTAVQTLQYQEEQNKALPPNLEPRPEHEVMDGDILFTRAGPMNRVGILCVARPTRNKLMISDKIIRFHLITGIDPDFAALSMNAGHSSSVVEGLKSGMAASQVNISQPKLRSVPIPLPPLAEQKRIVAKVDALMALCDRLEAQQQEREEQASKLARASLARFADAPTPANLPFLFHPSYAIPPADLRKSILTLAVQGKLVPQDPNDEPALVLLDQIAAHKAALAKEGKLRGSAAVKPMADDETEFEIPSNWCWVRFGEIMVNRDGERIPVSKEERETKAKTYDYYGASGIIDKIDGYLFDKPLLLIGEDGANLINRSTPIAFIARGKYWVNNHAHVLDGISEDFLRFIELHINAINLEKYVTGSAQPKMNQAKMNTIPVALPPLAEQRRIVAKVEQLMALVDALERQLAASRTTAQKLLEALVAELTSTHSK